MDEGGPGTNGLRSGPISQRKPRKPFYKDPLSILGWGVALASIVAYWSFFVRQPVPRPGEQVARITGLSGTVRVKPYDREVWKRAALEDVLRVGDVVQTEPASGVRISFDGGSEVRVRPESNVYVGGSAELSTAAWRVQSGRVNFSAGDHVTQIVTPTVTATAQRNATGSVDVGAEGQTGIKVFTGEADVETRRGQHVSLAENEAVQVDARGQAGERQALPPPPQLLSPKLKATLPFASPPAASAELEWKPVAHGETYHVTLDYNVVQADLLLSATLDEPSIRGTRHELQGLDPGRYFWRVAGVNEAGLEGAFSQVSLFSIGPWMEPTPEAPQPPAPPTLWLAPIESVAAGVLLVRGRTEPGSVVSLDGHAISVRPDGSFSEYVRRTGREKVTARAVNPAGRSAAQTRLIPREP